MVAIVLRLKQSALPGGRHRVTVTLREGGDEWEGTSDFAFALTGRDREDLRWYLEDYLEYPLDPAPAIAARVERRMTDVGAELFEKVFAAANARDAWSDIRNRLGSVRVEVDADVEGATVLPWELLLDPKTGQHVAVQVKSFVRVHRGRAVRSAPPATADRLRLLLVICRPAGRSDVPFRSVASHLIRLGEHATDVLDVDVLRPPTFDHLTAVLESAHQAGRPYHAVHFDGHGTYVDLATLSGGNVPHLDRNRYSTPGAVVPGPHGYLLFEDPDHPSNQSLVGGSTLGALLARTSVGVLLLNACRSAYTEAPEAPQSTDGNPHERVRAYGSLALEVAEQGVGGVVAMRYNVYVVTAAQFVANLYTALLAGRPLGEAVTAGRKQLWAKPDRVITDRPRPLQDWSVPIVYEAVADPILAPSAHGLSIEVSLDSASGLSGDALPRRPDAGFFGRDETILALDRAFDRHRVVLLHGYAGSGKTTTAVEFARWYQHTGGLNSPLLDADGPVVFSSLEHYKPLPSLLNDWGAVLAPLLSANGVEWNAVNEDTQRRAIAVQVMQQVPVLWIWDNVEPVAGFPANAESNWTDAEQTELADFLRELTASQARILLTSRRDERRWLGDALPRRIQLSAMPMREMIQLTKALADRRGHRITDVEDWRPLLRYAAGNPLTVTVLVSQVLRQGLTRRAALESFVAQLRTGEADIDNDEAKGRTHSLAASLNYGFANAFTEEEQAQLNVLHHFRDVVNVSVLVHMGKNETKPVAVWTGMTRETGIALLDRAVDIGLLESLRSGYYSIHPALPLFLQRAASVEATDAYVAAIAALAVSCNRTFSEGRTGVLWTLNVEESNLLHARAIAFKARRWSEAMDCMSGLDILYKIAARQSEWTRLLDEFTDDLVDPDNGGPRPGTDNEWLNYVSYRIQLAHDAHDWNTSRGLQQALNNWRQQRVDGLLAKTSSTLTNDERHLLRSFAGSEFEQGVMLSKQGDEACLKHLAVAYKMFDRIEARNEQATTALTIGNAYLAVSTLIDLDEAERWYQRALDMHEPADHFSRAVVHQNLGVVSQERFRAARSAGADVTLLTALLGNAEDRYNQALSILPDEAIATRGALHNQLANVHAEIGAVEAALQHYQLAIRYMDAAQDHYHSGITRENVAGLLRFATRYDDALLYAHAALRELATLGAGAAAETARVEQLITQIENDLQDTA